jgi:hypothetical protein
MNQPVTQIETTKVLADPPRKPKQKGPTGIGFFLVAAAALFIAIAAFGIYPLNQWTAPVQPRTNEAARMRVEVVHLEKSTGMIHLQLPGQTMPYTDAPIFAQTSGYLKKWYFEIGSASDTGEQHWLQCARGGRVRCGRADACRGQPWRRDLAVSVCDQTFRSVTTPANERFWSTMLSVRIAPPSLSGSPPAGSARLLEKLLLWATMARPAANSFATRGARKRAETGKNHLPTCTKQVTYTAGKNGDADARLHKEQDRGDVVSLADHVRRELARAPA